MTTYLTTPYVIHNIITKYLTKDDLFNLRFVSKSVKKIILNHGVVILPVTSLQKLNEVSSNNKMFKKIFLNVSFNNVSYEKIIKTFEKNVIQLNLSYAHIGPCGGKDIGTALKTNTCLKYLYCIYNSLGSMGMVDIAEALKVNTTLQTLSIGSNNIGNEGAIALIEALKVNTSLQILCCIENDIDPKYKKMLRNVAETKDDFILYL
jgi:Ran GTPase-activating protein (RanGAP) involved in mRNA processing and transport